MGLLHDSVFTSYFGFCYWVGSLCRLGPTHAKLSSSSLVNKLDIDGMLQRIRYATANRASQSHEDPVTNRRFRSSALHHVDRLRSFVALSDFKFHTFAFIECLETIPLNSAVVNKDVATAV